MNEELQEWRYLPYGRVRHLLHDGSSFAYCAKRPWLAEEWRGTGSQDEYEHCARLPRCKVCMRQAAMR